MQVPLHGVGLRKPYPCQTHDLKGTILTETSWPLRHIAPASRISRNIGAPPHTHGVNCPGLCCSSQVAAASKHRIVVRLHFEQTICKVFPTCRLVNKSLFPLVQSWFPDLCDLSMDVIENWGFGASPIRTSVWCSPACVFFSGQHIIFMSVEWFLIKMDLICQTGILTLVEFWWVP